MSKKVLSAKEYLEQLQTIDTKIDQKLEQLAAMKQDACSSGGIDYSKVRVQTSPSGDQIGDAVTRYVTFDEEINADIDRFVDAKNRIIKEIQNLNVDNYIKVLFKVYVQYKSIKNASTEMKMSYQYVRTLHKKALEMFGETYKNLHYLT